MKVISNNLLDLNVPIFLTFNELLFLMLLTFFLLNDSIGPTFSCQRFILYFHEVLISTGYAAALI